MKAQRLVHQADCKQYWGDQTKLRKERYNSDIRSKMNFFNGVVVQNEQDEIDLEK